MNAFEEMAFICECADDEVVFAEYVFESSYDVANKISRGIKKIIENLKKFIEGVNKISNAKIKTILKLKEIKAVNNIRVVDDSKVIKRSMIMVTKESDKTIKKILDIDHKVSTGKMKPADGISAMIELESQFMSLSDKVENSAVNNAKKPTVTMAQYAAALAELTDFQSKVINNVYIKTKSECTRMQKEAEALEKKKREEEAYNKKFSTKVKKAAAKIKAKAADLQALISFKLKTAATLAKIDRDATNQVIRTGGIINKAKAIANKANSGSSKKKGKAKSVNESAEDMSLEKIFGKEIEDNLIEESAEEPEGAFAFGSCFGDVEISELVTESAADDILRDIEASFETDDEENVPIEEDGDSEEVIDVIDIVLG